MQEETASKLQSKDSVRTSYSKSYVLFILYHATVTLNLDSVMSHVSLSFRPFVN